MLNFTFSQMHYEGEPRAYFAKDTSQHMVFFWKIPTFRISLILKCFRGPTLKLINLDGNLDLIQLREDCNFNVMYNLCLLLYSLC